MAAGVVLRVLLRCKCIHVDYLVVGRSEEARLDGTHGQYQRSVQRDDFVSVLESDRIAPMNYRVRCQSRRRVESESTCCHAYQLQCRPCLAWNTT